MSLFRKPNFMRSGVERFRDQLEKEIGYSCTVFRHPSTNKKLPTVFILVFKDAANPRTLMAFSYGLSAATASATRTTGRELAIRVNSELENWGHILGFLINHLREDCPFDPGQIIRFGQSIATDSQMKHFLVHDVDPDLGISSSFTLSKRFAVDLVQLSPIYDEELSLIDRIGWAKFYTALHSIKENVSRKRITGYK